MSTVRVLSIDGGGIRGIIPARVIAEIEERCGQPVADLFDFIAGTSTGGIIALALNKPDGSGKRPDYGGRDLVRFYEQHGRTIFSRSLPHRLGTAAAEMSAAAWRPWNALGRAGERVADRLGGPFAIAKLPGRIGDLAQQFGEFFVDALGPRYTSRGVEEVLQEYFGTTQMHEAIRYTMVPSYDSERPEPYLFKSWRSDGALIREGERRQPDYKMWEAARATSAAPVFFPPMKLAADGTSKSLIDGGVFANNPALCALAEARRVFERHGEQHDYLVVSIGTGSFERKVPYARARTWGALDWAVPIFYLLQDGVGDSVDYELFRLLAPHRYFRFQPKLAEVSQEIDDARPETILRLKQIADDMLAPREHDSQRLDVLCEELRKTARDRLKVPQVQVPAAGERPEEPEAQPVH